ncbi:MAG: ABC transporter substrate-binding protein [Chthoniobacterales bacterium]|nr:ABC transporter substrate-binding protein [Chthoniobacterales bacterium]
MTRSIRLFSAALSVVFLAACGGPKSDAVKIGMNLELTGDIPAVGASSKNAAELFFEQINKEGGVALEGGPKKVELVVRDNGAKADQAASVAQQLISSQGVVAMIGPNSSACAIPAGEIAESLKCVMMSPWSTNPRTTTDTTSGAPKRYVFRGCFTDPFEALVLAKFALNNLGAKRAAVLYDVASEAPVAQSALFKETFTANGGEIVAFETFTTGDKDFSAQLTNIREANPDIIFLPTYYNDVPLIAQQARRLGINVPFIGSDAWSSPEIIKLGGADVDGSYFCNHFSTQIATDEAKKFVTDYTAKYGQAPDDVAALTYDACGLMTEAIEKAGKNDREALREALSQIREYKGVTGTFRFEPGSGDPIKSAVVLQIKDGAFQWVTNAQP